jgi:hypothetical protein
MISQNPNSQKGAYESELKLGEAAIFSFVPH